MTEAWPFVVLHHTGYGPPHFDLMLAIDAAGPLRTWRCPAWPIGDGDACVPLPPHRRAYLTYEGEVSGGRGRVRRVAAGRGAGRRAHGRRVRRRTRRRPSGLTRTGLKRRLHLANGVL